MTAENAGASAIDRLEQDDYGSRELAASRLALEALVSLNRAVAASGLTQVQLADALGVGASRVSQVLNGDGNLLLATYARFLRATGYKVTLGLEAVEEGRPALPPLKKSTRRRRPRSRVAEREFIKVFEAPIFDESGSSTAVVISRSPSPDKDVMLGNPSHVGTFTHDGASVKVVKYDVSIPGKAISEMASSNG